MASSFYVHSFVTVSLKGVSIYKCLIKRWQGIIEKNVFFKTSREINKKSNASVLVTGGGVYNNYLIERLKFHSKNTIIIPSQSIIEFKEALIFAFLGVLKLRNEVNCLKSVTGAIINHSSGKIYLP